MPNTPRMRILVLWSTTLLSQVLECWHPVCWRDDCGVGCRFPSLANRVEWKGTKLHGNPFDWNLKEVSEALGPPFSQRVQRQRRSQTQSSVENRRVQRSEGVGVMVPSKIHE